MLEPIPSTSAPILESSRARSWTCGSQAAFLIVVGPGVSAAAISAFSVPITEGSSMKMRAGLQAPGRGAELDPAVATDAGPELAEGIQVRVEPAAPDDVAARRGHARLPEPGQQRPRDQERGADPARKLLVDRGLGHRCGAQAQAVVGDPAHLDAKSLQQRELCLGVADPRHVVEQQLLLGEQAGGDDRKRGVLVACRADLARERDAALYYEFLHRNARKRGLCRRDTVVCRSPAAGATRVTAAYGRNFARRRLGAVLRVDRVRLAAQARARRSRPGCGPTPADTARTRSCGR